MGEGTFCDLYDNGKASGKLIFRHEFLLLVPFDERVWKDGNWVS